MSGTTHGNYKLLSSYPSDVELDENEKYAPDNGSESSGSINDKLEKNKSSLWKSVCNLIVTLEGMGLLSLPYVVQHGGWPAVAALTIVPFICYYTGKILVECLYDVHEDNKIRTRSNYKQLGEACWPKYGGIIVGTMQVMHQMLIESLYLVLFSSLMSGMLPSLPITDRLWMLIAAFVVLPMTFFQHLSQIAWISLVGVVALTVAICTVIGYGVSTSTHWNIGDIPLWDLKGVPLVLPIIIFSFGCHTIFPGVESDMADPTKFKTMLGLSFFSVFLVKILFSFIGFLSFSSNIKEVITNSLPQGTILILSNCFLLINVIGSYPILFLIIIQCIEDYLPLESVRSRFNDMFLMVSTRIIVSVLILLPAITIPRFALMIAFIGSFSATSLVFILPCIFHLRIKSTTLRWYEIATDYVIIVFGICSGMLGILFTGKALIRSYTT